VILLDKENFEIPFTKITLLEGKHSTVIAFPELEISIKIFKHSLVKNAIKEYEILKELSEKNYWVPKPYALILKKHPILIREYIEGVYFKDFLNKATKENIRKVIWNILQFAYKLDLHGIFLDELSHPTKNIIITKDLKTYIVDFERACKDSQRSNVTQFLSFIYRTGLESSPLGSKIVALFELEQIRKVIPEYKKERRIDVISKIFKNGDKPQS